MDRLRQHGIFETRHLILNPFTENELTAGMCVFLDRGRRSHLAYGRRYLGWGVSVLRAARQTT